MSTRLAILAGSGQLPREIAKAVEGALYVTFEGAGGDAPDGVEHLGARFEKLGALFAALRAGGVGQVVFAGAMTRPALDPSAFDETTLRVMPAIMQAMRKGDDALLRAVAAVFEAEGFAVLGAHELVPGLTLEHGTLVGKSPSAAEELDAAKAYAILAALGGQDVGQSCVVEGGLCLGIETLQGTDAMLGFVAATPAHLRAATGGVFVKLPKPGQDLRFDMPAVGPETLSAVAAAGLSGLVIGAGGVIVLEREEVFRLAESLGLFLTAR